MRLYRGGGEGVEWAAWKVARNAAKDVSWEMALNATQAAARNVAWNMVRTVAWNVAWVEAGAWKAEKTVEGIRVR